MPPLPEKQSIHRPPHIIVLHMQKLLFKLLEICFKITEIHFQFASAASKYFL
jgi:hypothetical protein